MSQDIFSVPDAWKKRAHIDAAKYKSMYAESLKNPEEFWGRQAEQFIWKKKWSKVKDTSFHISSPSRREVRRGAQITPSEQASPHPNPPPDGEGVFIRWYEGGALNITENCLDRHLKTRGDQTAIIWEGDDPKESRHITYCELHAEVCKFSSVLRKNGVKKGDCVTLYMPMIPEAAVAMLACARIGAVHSVVFGGFSADALRGRIEGCNSKLVITADEGLRGGKKVPLKKAVDEAVQNLPFVEHVVVVKRTGGQVAWHARDVWYHEEMAGVSADCPAEIMDAEDPLFILYTSGSTGKPKGVLHTTGGYMVWAAMTHKYVFDYHDGDIYWCTADVGWITGHTYIVYGPLLNGAITLMFEGIPSYPDAGRFWQVVDKHKVNTFYTAPTAIRAMMQAGDEFVKKSSRQSLKLLGSVGEPINPEAWLWYYRVVGDGRCPIMDTWWQTETGGHVITPLPGAIDLKPGSATFPFFGIRPVLIDANGKEVQGAGDGMLCIADSWPGQMRSVFGDHKRFEETYFSQYPGYYFSGDGARRDADGYYWITGRVDDVLKISGHRIGTADVESALVGHAHVTEAAVVGYPHDIKGQGIYCYVTLHAGAKPSPELEKELVQHVRKVLGPIATPDYIQFTPGLPKTRSGKIMRRILRKIAEGDVENLGDISTLTNPEIVTELVKGKRN